MASSAAVAEKPSEALAVPAHIPPELVVDFDYIQAAQQGGDPFEAMAALAETDAPRVFWTPRNGGHWVCLEFDAMIDVCRNNEMFHNFPVGLNGMPGKPRKLIPLEYDPPEHNKYRKILGPMFTPNEIAKLRGYIRDLARELVAEIKPKGRCDFVRDFSRKLPTRLFLELAGMPVERLTQFLEWEEDFFCPDLERRTRGGHAIAKYIGEFVADKRNHLANDVASVLFQSEVDGRPMTDEEVYDICFLLFIAGLDTVPNTFAFSWRYLAEHPEAREYLKNPDHIPDAVEELLRLNSVVNMTRHARNDQTWRGVFMKEGEAILLPCAIVNRDPEQFEDPKTVILDRSSNRHVAFGAGHHRCLGSHLARAEFQIALEEWLKEIPDFRLVPGTKPEARGGGSMGLLNLELEWDV